QGDALIAFRQGPATQPQLMAAVAKAPPGAFLAQVPSGWIERSAASVTWTPAPEAFGGTTYRLVIDGRLGARSSTALRARIGARGLGDGVHSVQVLATDQSGQKTATPRVSLKIDANPPEVTVTKPRRRVLRVHVFDRGSGAVARATSIAF